MTVNYPTLSEDRHSLLCVENVLQQAMHENQSNAVIGALELALRAVEHVTRNMEAVENAERRATTAPAGSPADHMKAQAEGPEAKATHASCSPQEPQPEPAGHVVTLTPDEFLQHGVRKAYRLACRLGDRAEEVEDVRRALVGLSMGDGMPEYAIGTLNLATAELLRVVEAIEGLTEPVAAEYRKAHGLEQEAAQ